MFEGLEKIAERCEEAGIAFVFATVDTKGEQAEARGIIRGEAREVNVLLLETLRNMEEAYYVKHEMLYERLKNDY